MGGAGLPDRDGSAELPGNHATDAQRQLRKNAPAEPAVYQKLYGKPPGLAGTGQCGAGGGGEQ
ncbi:hypothetical protein D3C75_994110 [compost metagenome]